jgi:hypothetical protein
VKRTVLALCLFVACALIANAQKAETTTSGEANVQTTATASQANKNLNLESGTTLTGQLQKTIDVRHAKIGDQVVLKTTQAIKSGGRTVVSKGSRLVGHVTDVAQKSKDRGESRIAILFDRLEQGALQFPIAATITSITSGSANVRANNDDLFASDTMASGSANSTGSARSSSAGNSGLLGGVGGVVNSTTSTAGSVAGNTTSAVGNTVGSTTNAVGNTASSAGRSLRGVQVSQSSNTSVEGGSVISFQGGDLRLEKGTNFNLAVTQSASAGTTKDQ